MQKCLKPGVADVIPGGVDFVGGLRDSSLVQTHVKINTKRTKACESAVWLQRRMQFENAGLFVFGSLGGNICVCIFQEVLAAGRREMRVNYVCLCVR